MLNIGDKAPDFNLEGSRETSFSLNARKSAFALLVFYPKNNTPG
jgi:peroxiredoxin